MESEKPWLENDLTLDELARRVGCSPHHLSQLFNERLRQTFYDYINERRVRDVQRCLADPAYDGQPVLDVALAAGWIPTHRRTISPPGQRQRGT
jgi:AraC-like DNA-binding protein